MAKKPPMSNKRYLSIWAPIIAFFTLLTVVATYLLAFFDDAVSSQLGYGTYEVENTADTEDWDTEYSAASYDSIDEVIDASEDLVREIASEGFVLTKNNGALPLAAPGAVTLLGRNAADPIYGGAGSGAVDTSEATSIHDGMEMAGFEVNDTVYGELEAFAASNVRFEIIPPWLLGEDAQTNFRIGEMPVAEYTDAALDSFAEYGDAAIVVVGRPGGEAGDLTRDMSEWDDNYWEGQHQLQLNQDELDQVALAKENFDTVIVVVNAATSLELGVLENDPDVDAIIVAGPSGATGFEALGLIMNGDVNPSGRLVDTWVSDFTTDPVWQNWGFFKYTNWDDDTSPTGMGTFVEYEEGVYAGYRYWETAAAEGFIDYDESVVYPFGYGLSYTDFAWEISGQELGGVEGDISVDVTVTNTGDVAGKDVVQLYFSAPYYEGGIEKAEVVLGDFAKTGILEPGASETVTLTLAVEDMASYDWLGEAAYVLEEGEYELLVQQNSHDLADGVEPVVYTVEDSVVYDEEGRVSDLTEVTNRFDDVNAHFADFGEGGIATTLSRADFAGTFPTRPTDADMVASEAIIADFQAYDQEAAAAAFEGEMPTTGEDAGLEIIDMRGLDKDDPLWDELVEQLTVDELTTLVMLGGYQTAAIDSIGLPAGTHSDGPIGFGNFVSAALDQGVAYPGTGVLAGTFNKDLARQMGQMIGDEALLRGITGWYAPGVNMHRSPFSGRNFEYYSEDPILTGLVAIEVVSGALDKGLPTYIKHFAINDQETNRSNNGLATWVNEQAIREIYLKPFEMVVKNAEAEMTYIADSDGTLETTTIGSLAMMSSFNRVGSVWTGGSYPLMTDVLRGEWGFDGSVISDFNNKPYAYVNQSIMAGTDLTMAYENAKEIEDNSSAEAVTQMQKSAKNILFSITNSNLMNGIASGAEITYHLPAWRYWQAGITALVGLVIAAGVVVVTRRVRRHSSSVAVEVPEPTDRDAVAVG